jgi:hypothetical protein
MLDREAEDLVRCLLTWDPSQRLGSGGVHQIQRHPFFATIAWGSLEAEVLQDQQLYDEAHMQQLQQNVDQLAGSIGNGGCSSHRNGSNGAGQQYSLMEERERVTKASYQAESPASRWGL